MFIPVGSIVMLLIGTLLAFIFIIITLVSGKYDELCKPLDKKEFPLRETYSIGCKILEIIKYGYNSKSDRKLRKSIEILYGVKYSDYYLRMIMAQRITFAVFLLLVAFAFYAITLEIVGFFILVMFSGLAYYYYGDRVNKNIEKREQEMMKDYPEVLSKLVLLTNAGMILRDAWENVAFSGEGVLFDEMKKVVVDIQNGVAEIDAFFSFSMRCSIPEIKKFTSTLVQGMTKGNHELVMLLKEQSKEAWEARKFNVKIQGEHAKSKLLIPISLMCLGILVMIIIPIFSNLGI